MKIKVKIIWVIVELITVALGTGLFVYATLNSDFIAEDAGFSAFMIVLGLLARDWRNELFYSNAQSIQRSEKDSKKSRNKKNVILGVFVIVAFSLLIRNKNEIRGISRGISSLELEVSNIDYTLREYIDQKNRSNSYSRGFR